MTYHVINLVGSVEVWVLVTANVDLTGVPRVRVAPVGGGSSVSGTSVQWLGAVGYERVLSFVLVLVDLPLGEYAGFLLVEDAGVEKSIRFNTTITHV